MNWISVNDKLPKDYESNCCLHDFVLVYSTRKPDGPKGMYALAQWSESGWEILGNEGAYSCVGSFEMKSEDITHWMPLPDGPV